MIAKPNNCRTCPGWTWGHEGYSVVSGDGSLPLMVVAEASGSNEARLGRPLVETAPAGGMFQKALDMAGASRDVLSLTNVLRCQPPGNELRGASYERAVIDHCKPYLDEAVGSRTPRVILTLGDTPLRELSTTSGSITELRGFVLESRYGIPMVATYHPSFLARGAMHLFGVFLHDIRQALRFATRGIPERITTNYVTTPTSADVLNYLGRLRADGSLASAYDTETASILGEKEPDNWRHKRIIQIQFSSAIGEALVLPWTPPWLEAIKEILATANPKWGWNDRLSDRLVLRGNGIVINGEQHDLMNAWGHLQPNFMSLKDAAAGDDKGVPAKLMSLQSCLSFYYPEEGPYKGMVGRAVEAAKRDYDETCAASEGAFADVDPAEFILQSVLPVLRFYGAKDADYTFRLGMKLMTSLRKLGLW